MTDLQLLLLVLALIYAWECACWLRRGSVGFIRWFRGWRITHPGPLLGNQKGSFVFANPLPPLGTILVANQWPVSLSTEAMFAYVAASVNPGGRPLQTAKLVPFSQVESIEARGRTIRVNKECFLEATSPGFAREVARRLRELSKLSGAKRARAIESLLEASFDASAAEQRWRQFQKDSRALAMVANFLFGYLFVFAPVLIWLVGFRQCWVGLLAGLAAFTASLAWLFRSLHLKLYPTAEDERFTQCLTVLLSPATAIRARDMLTRPLLETFHPLTLTRVVGTASQFKSLARESLREIRHPARPICPLAEPAAEAVERAWRSQLERRIEKFLRQSDLDLEELGRPPVPLDPACRSYCPRCLAQFVTETGRCQDCGGLETVGFPAAISAQEVMACSKP